ncbi:MAG: zinc-dependent alcohol dehydrogenase [Anaerolineales bacterium]
MKRRSLYFEGPGQVNVREESIPSGEPGQVLVEVETTAISAGTELLFYRGQIPDWMATDATIESLQQSNTYPLKYGYQSVGRVVEGPGNLKSLVGKKVFAFQPHESRYWSDPKNLILLPEELDLEDAVLLPTMETAVNFLLDGKPLLGERVIVFGQGVVGLLTTSLLSQFPLTGLITVDSLSSRRNLSLQMGANFSFGLEQAPAIREMVTGLAGSPNGADLIFEISGAPEALDLAIEFAGFSSRIIVGSWYGTKLAKLNLGGPFHRNRIQIKSSQVSTIDPTLLGRWTKERRLELAMEHLGRVQPSQLITHRFPIEQASSAYKLLDDPTEDLLQVTFTYDH